MPDASAAAHVALNPSGAGSWPGVNRDHASPSPSRSSLSPSGDQLNEWTAPLANSFRGKPDSLTIHNAPGVPSALAVVKATQWRRGRTAPVVQAMLSSLASLLPSASRAAVVMAMA